MTQIKGPVNWYSYSTIHRVRGAESGAPWLIPPAFKESPWVDVHRLMGKKITWQENAKQCCFRLSVGFQGALIVGVLEA